MTKDLTSGSPLKVILMFTPLVLGNLFQQPHALADTIIAGRFSAVSVRWLWSAQPGRSTIRSGFLSSAFVTALQFPSRSCLARGITVICAAMGQRREALHCAAWCRTVMTADAPHDAADADAR